MVNQGENRWWNYGSQR